MSKNVSIKEGDRARNFGPTAKIKTELQAGGSCYWVPEDERETGHIFASENREYTPDEIDKYGIDSIDVNIIFTGTTIDGDPWSVTIDPDTGLPIIDIDDVEITIDDITGDVDIHFPGNDPDDWPGWDDLDPDLKKDFDDWVNDGNDPDDWPGWDDLDPSIKDDFDGWINDTDITIDDADLDDFGIDPDSDIDISIDDLGNIDISDGDISIDFDPETGEWDTGECPASIKIMHVPTKTSYKDGEAIDLDGIVVQAFNSDGTPWSSSRYPDGYIPTHELVPDEKYAEYDKSADLAGMLDGSFLYKKNDGTIESGSIFSHAISPLDEDWSGSTGGGSATVSRIMGGWLVTMSYGSLTMGPYGLAYGDIAFKTVFYPDGSSAFMQYRISAPHWGNTLVLSAEETQEVTKDSYYFKDDESGQILNIGWTSPCLTDYSAHVDLVTNPQEDHDGSHHSGKF